MKLNDVLLGLIHLHPGVTGYELRAIIADSTGYFFSTSLSRIYPALKELSDRGYVSIEVALSPGRQDRKKYTITQSGSQHLAEVLRTVEPMPMTEEAFDALLLHLTFIGYLPDCESLRYLDTQLAQLEAHRGQLTAGHLNRARDYLHLDGQARARYLRIWESEYAFLVRQLDARLAWLRELRETLAVGAPSDEPVRQTR